METPSRYIVVIENSLIRFEAEVGIKLKEGWKLQGGVSIGVTSGGSNHYAQALVK